MSTCCRSREPSFMIAPRPNCFSIARIAASTALPRSACGPFRAPLVGHRHRFVTLLIDPLDRSPERATMAPGRLSPLRRLPRRPASACAASGSARRSAADPTAARASAGRACPSASSWLPCRDGFASPSLRLRVVIQAIGRPFTRTYRRTSSAAHPARARTQLGHRGGEGSGPDRGSDPGHEV